MNHEEAYYNYLKEVGKFLTSGRSDINTSDMFNLVSDLDDETMSDSVLRDRKNLNRPYTKVEFMDKLATDTNFAKRWGVF